MYKLDSKIIKETINKKSLSFDGLLGELGWKAEDFEKNAKNCSYHDAIKIASYLEVEVSDIKSKPGKKASQLTWESLEGFLATAIIEQAKTSAKRWFVAWLVTLIALVGTNAAWLYVWQSYEYVSQDGSGINSINTGNQEDIDYGADSQVEEEP
mgnify:FL=1